MSQRTILIISAIIIPLTILITNHLVRVKESKNHLLSIQYEAKSLGIGTSKDRATKVDRVRKAKPTAPAILGKFDHQIAQYLTDKYNSSRGGKEPDIEEFHRMRDIIESLDDAHFHQYILDVMAFDGLLESERLLHCRFAFGLSMALDSKNGIQRYQKFPSMFNSRLAHANLGPALVSWGEINLEEALAWVENFTLTDQSSGNDAIDSSEIKRAKLQLIKQLAGTDRIRSLKMLKQLKINHFGSSAFEILQNSRSTSDLSTSLSDTLQFESEIDSQDDRQSFHKSAMSYFGWECGQMIFEDAIAWIDQSNLSGQDINQFGYDFCDRIQSGDEAKWIDWLETKLPDDNRKFFIDRFLDRWTRKDYRAVGHWINTLPDNGKKYQVINLYAQTIGEYEGNDAVRWIESIPEAYRSKDALLRIQYRLEEENPDNPMIAEEFGSRNHLPLR